MRAAAQPPLTIERARPEDAASVEALLDAAARWQQASGIDQWTPGRFAGEVRQTIATGELFVARRAGELVGCFMLDTADPPAFTRWLAEQGREAPPGAHLARMAIAREASGSGLGVELLDAACDLARGSGLGFVRLECPAGNARLRRYYTDAGFVHRGDLETRGPNGEEWVISLLERPTMPGSAPTRSHRT